MAFNCENPQFKEVTEEISKWMHPGTDERMTRVKVFIETPGGTRWYTAEKDKNNRWEIK